MKRSYGLIDILVLKRDASQFILPVHPKTMRPDDWYPAAPISRVLHPHGAGSGKALGNRLARHTSHATPHTYPGRLPGAR